MLTKSLLQRHTVAKFIMHQDAAYVVRHRRQLQLIRLKETRTDAKYVGQWQSKDAN
jgi:hypothetical protein